MHMKLKVSETKIKTKMNSKGFSLKSVLQISAIAAVSIFGLATINSAHAAANVCFSAVAGFPASIKSQTDGTVAPGHPASCATGGNYTFTTGQSANVFNTGASGGEALNWQVDQNTVPAWLTVGPSPYPASGTNVPPGGATASTPPPVFTVNSAGLPANDSTPTVVSVTFNGQSVLPNGGGTVSAGTDTVTVNYWVLNPCSIISFNADSTSIPVNSATNLNWTTSAACTSATLNGSSVALNGSQSTGNLARTTSYTFCARGTYQSAGCQTVFINVTSACTLSASASPVSVAFNNPSTLSWTSSGCTNITVTSVVPSDGTTFNATALAVPNGSVGTGNLSASQTYNFSASGPGGTATATVSVSVGGACVINVNAKYNGASGNPPGNPYNYTITSGSSGSPINSSEQQTFSEPADNQTWTIAYTGGVSAGISYNGLDSSTPNSQSCAITGGTMTFTLDFSTSVGPPSNAVDSNTACGIIALSWVAGSNATSYDIYRTDSSSNTVEIADKYAGISYNDSSGASGASYTYSIISYSPFGTSSSVTFSPSPIVVIPCEVNLSTSSKQLESVQGQTFPYASCVSSQGGTAPTISTSNLLEFRIDVCNTGNIAAQSVTVSDVIDLNSNHLMYIPGGGSTPPASATAGPGPGQETVVWNLGIINPGQNQTITIFASTNAAGSTATQLRLLNKANIYYTTSGSSVSAGGCVGSFANAGNPCTVIYGPVPFYNGANLPTQHEITP